MSTRMERLRELKDYGGRRRTVGLEDEVVERFLAVDPHLGQAIDEAYAAHLALREEWADELHEDEPDLVDLLQDDLLNFYAADTINPYVPLAARGPWMVTSHGAVLHDNGGYGMLGFGHGPVEILTSMGRPYVMANVMTPSFAHRRFTDRLRAEIGQVRPCPFHRFVCLNSGSEVMTIASRISDIGAKRQVGAGGPKEGWTVRTLSLQGSFHGRTDRPAHASHSTLAKYKEHLHSFVGMDTLLTVPANDVAALEKVFADAEANKVFIEAMFMEPVQGEGDPGVSMTRAFYDAARRLTKQHGTMLIVDSIQAGLRGTGYLSIVDYPGFEDCEVPDMESWSKALNGGQYPLSVLGLSEAGAHLYARGVYGNTMTTNPRALEVGCAVLDAITPELRENIRLRGQELVARLVELQKEFPDLITRVQGTGLLVAAHIDPEKLAVVGADGLEIWCRRHGLGVIHGGKNALRFTPHFAITSAELEVIVRVVRQGLRAVLSAELAADTVKEVEVAR
ncbi:MAG: aminotransferase class III-fold pyridoxal phosphate-dependent enzyme [Myxococcales bacterium]|nr:aminotransferase class III-fold pyridoxal phosphate-dependent enzyme [Myxococcales bacterium]